MNKEHLRQYNTEIHLFATMCINHGNHLISLILSNVVDKVTEDIIAEKNRASTLPFLGLLM